MNKKAKKIVGHKTVGKKKSAVVTKETPAIVGTTVSGCTFIGVQYDAKAVEAITMIAEGLIQNAKALHNLSCVLRDSNVQIESMMKIGA